MAIEVRPERYDSAIATALVEALDRDLTMRYGPGTPPSLDADTMWPPHGVFLVARLDAVPVGCAGLRPLPTLADDCFHSDRPVGEIKRMFTHDRARRRGVGRALLDALDQHAVALGYRRLVLETGVYQPEARALYDRSGFTPIGCWGRYAEDPLSVCYSKLLG